MLGGRAWRHGDAELREGREADADAPQQVLRLGVGRLRPRVVREGLEEAGRVENVLEAAAAGRAAAARRRRRRSLGGLGGLGHEDHRHLDAGVGEGGDGSLCPERRQQRLPRGRRRSRRLVAAARAVLVRVRDGVVEGVRLAHLGGRVAVGRPRAVAQRVELGRHVVRLLALADDVREVLGERERLRDAVRERVEVVVPWQRRAAAPRERVARPDRRAVDDGPEAHLLQRGDHPHRVGEAALDPVERRREEVEGEVARRALAPLGAHRHALLVRPHQQPVALLPHVRRAGEVAQHGHALPVAETPRERRDRLGDRVLVLDDKGGVRHAQLVGEAARPQPGRVDDGVGRQHLVGAVLAPDDDLEAAVRRAGGGSQLAHRLHLGIEAELRAVGLGVPRDRRRQHRRVDVAVLGREDAALDAAHVDERMERGDLVRAEHRRRQRRVVVQLRHRYVLLRLEQPVVVALLDQPDGPGEVQSDATLLGLVHRRHQVERAHVHLLDLGRAAEARHQARRVPRGARAELARLLEHAVTPTPRPARKRAIEVPATPPPMTIVERGPQAIRRPSTISVQHSQVFGMA